MEDKQPGEVTVDKNNLLSLSLSLSFFYTNYSSMFDVRVE